MKEFRGKVAVVTGAASGIGLEFARRFAAEGMNVALADIQAEPLAVAEAELRLKGVEVLAMRTNVANAREIEALADATFARFGNVHVLCNNAGVGPPTGMVWELSGDDWEWVLGVNLRSVIHGIRAFLPRMIASGEQGHVVNTASMAGLVTGRGPYGVTKHAVVALSESLLNDLRVVNAPIGVTVLCPGWVNTNIYDSARLRPEEFGGPPGDQADPLAAQRREMGRQLLASGIAPEEIAGLVFDAIRDGRLYLAPGQPGMMEAVAMRHRAIETGNEPPLPGVMRSGRAAVG